MAVEFEQKQKERKKESKKKLWKKGQNSEKRIVDELNDSIFHLQFQRPENERWNESETISNRVEEDGVNQELSWVELTVVNESYAMFFFFALLCFPSLSLFRSFFLRFKLFCLFWTPSTLAHYFLLFFTLTSFG